ncbi:MAG: hypothetical protein KIS96_03620 [Bauldia sp.]|nr:hypothetical protein [Bauldia sp.]
MPRDHEMPGRDQTTSASLEASDCASPPGDQTPEEGQRVCAALAAAEWLPTSGAPTSDLTPTIAEIRAWHRRRVFAMDQRKRMNLALGSYLRTQLGWRRDLPAEERKRINDQAAALVKIGEAEARGKAAGVDEPAYIEHRDIISANIVSRSPWDSIEALATEAMERLARSLSVWTAWGEAIRGFGARSLGVIVAEAGDLAVYPKKGHLWKRLGLAPIEKGGVIRAGSTWRKGGLSDADWIAAGYSMRRRSFIFVIGDVLVKTAGPYREIYLHRKEFEKAKALAAGLKIVPSAKVPKGRGDEYMTDGHIHRRAQRYMEKALVRDLWVAWRRAIAPSTAEAA